MEVEDQLIHPPFSLPSSTWKGGKLKHFCKFPFSWGAGCDVICLLGVLVQDSEGRNQAGSSSPPFLLVFAICQSRANVRFLAFHVHLQLQLGPLDETDPWTAAMGTHCWVSKESRGGWSGGHSPPLAAGDSNQYSWFQRSSVVGQLFMILELFLAAHLCSHSVSLPIIF